MRKLTVFILLISFSNSISADMWEPNEYRAYFLYYYVAGFCVTPAFDLLWKSPHHSEDGLYFSPGIDPRMAIDGNLDLNLRLSYRRDRLEPFLAYETFPEIKYQGYSFGLLYTAINRKLGLLIGPEITHIRNRNPVRLTTALSWGVNTEVRYTLSRRISFSYVGNIKTRPDISKETIYSGYVLINFLIF